MSWFRLYLLSPILLGAVASVFSNRKKVFFIIYGVITFLFFALRTQYLGSGDSGYYYKLWEQLSRVPLSVENINLLFAIDMEKGFLIVIWILSNVFPNGQFVFVFSALVYTYCLCTFFYDNCDDYIFGILMVSSLGLTSFFLQGMRQSIAISICLLSVKYCKEKRLFRFLLTVVIAAFFHASALLFVLVYFAYGMELNWKSGLITCIVAVFSPFLLNSITVMANYFMKENYTSGNVEQLSNGVVTMILFVCLVVYCVAVCNERHSTGLDGCIYTEYSHALIMLVLCTAFFSMRFFYIPVFERASYYFLPFAPIAICATYHRYTEKSKGIVKAIFYCTFIFLALYKSNSTALLSTYRFFWNVM